MIYTGCTRAGVAYLLHICVQRVLGMWDTHSMLAALCILTTTLLGSIVRAGVVCGAAASGNYVWNDPTVSQQATVVQRRSLLVSKAWLTLQWTLSLPHAQHSSPGADCAWPPAALHTQTCCILQVSTAGLGHANG